MIISHHFSGFVKAFRSASKRMRLDASGSSAVEFAILAPLLMLILAGTADFGSVVYQKSRFNSAVSSASNYALTAFGANTEKPLSASIALVLVDGSKSARDLRIDVNANAGSTAAYRDGKIAVSGSDANGDRCYCPVGDGGAVEWSKPMECHRPCPDGTLSGKFVSISMSSTYYSLFPAFATGLHDANFAVASVVRVQ